MSAQEMQVKIEKMAKYKKMPEKTILDPGQDQIYIDMVS